MKKISIKFNKIPAEELIMKIHTITNYEISDNEITFYISGDIDIQYVHSTFVNKFLNPLSISIINIIFYTFFLLYVWTLMEDTFSQVLDLFPEPIKKIAGFGDDLSTAGFLNGEFMHLIGPLIMGAFGITIGSTILASEEENKTIDQFLSLSISRTRYYTEKYISLIILVFI